MNIRECKKLCKLHSLEIKSLLRITSQNIQLVIQNDDDEIEEDDAAVTIIRGCTVTNSLYNEAVIYLYPNKIETEYQLIESLIHEYCHVVVGLMSDECARIRERYIKNNKTKIIEAESCNRFEEQTVSLLTNIFRDIYLR